jgi:hypothetical protein
MTGVLAGLISSYKKIATVPDPPTSLSVTSVGNSYGNSMNVLFLIPANNGGSPITSYTLASSPVALTTPFPSLGTSNNSNISTSGYFAANQSYTFTVTATNAVGTSSPSTSSSSITPFNTATTWTSGTSSFSFSQPRLFNRGTTFFALNSGTSSSFIYSSTDGVNWTARTMPSSQSWSSFVYASAISLYVAISGALGSNSSAAATSTDGVTWTSRTMSSSHAWNGVTGFGAPFNNLIAIANDSPSGSNIASRSSDGITWTDTTMSSTRNWQGIAFSATTYVVISSFTVISTSPDGVTWTERTFPFGFASGIAFGNNVFVVVGGVPGQTSAYSSNGTSWTSRTMPSNNYWYSVTFGNNGFVATSSINQVATSPDGVTWTARTMPTSQNWFGSAWNGSTWVAIGSGTAIATAP